MLNKLRSCLTARVPLQRLACQHVISQSYRRFGGYWANQGQTISDDQLLKLQQNFSNLKDYKVPELRIWYESFLKMDFDYDGYISYADLQKSIDLSLEKIQAMKQYDADHNNLIDFGEFVNAMYEVDVKTLRESFCGFDNVDLELEFAKVSVSGTEDVFKHPHIPISGVIKWMKSSSFCVITQKDAEKLFYSIDKDHDGFISFDDFCKWARAV